MSNLFTWRCPCIKHGNETDIMRVREAEVVLMEAMKLREVCGDRQSAD